MKPTTPCPLWMPNFTYVWTRDQLRAWYLEHGHQQFRDGDLWTLDTYSLKCGLYQVTVVPYDPETRRPAKPR